jgi:hypothetical protein
MANYKVHVGEQFYENTPPVFPIFRRFKNDGMDGTIGGVK